MDKLVFKVFSVVVLMVLSLGGAQAQTLYGMEFNKSLKLPECQQKEPPYVPPKVCYVEQRQRVTDSGILKDGAVFFPEGRFPQGARSNYLHVALLNNKLVSLFYFTNGLSDQGAIFEMLKNRFGEPDMYDVFDEEDTSIAKGAIIGMWFTDGLVVQFMGGSQEGRGLVSVMTPAFAQSGEALKQGGSEDEESGTPM